MQISLMHDGVEVAAATAGQTIGIPGLAITPAEPGLSMMVPEGTMVLPGHYEIIAKPAPHEPDPIEFEPLTPEQARFLMPTLSPPQIRMLLIQVLGIQPEPDNDDLFDLLNQRIATAIASISDPMERAKARIYWETAQFYERTNPLVDLVGALTDPPLPPEDIDVAWLSAVGAEA